MLRRRYSLSYGLLPCGARQCPRGHGIAPAESATPMGVNNGHGGWAFTASNYACANNTSNQGIPPAALPAARITYVVVTKTMRANAFILKLCYVRHCRVYDGTRPEGFRFLHSCCDEYERSGASRRCSPCAGKHRMLLLDLSLSEETAAGVCNHALRSLRQVGRPRTSK